MAESYVGEIRMFAGNFAPVGWAFCNGQAMPISENESLFQLIGTAYGGDGESTFHLPDLRGRVPIHAGQGPATRMLGNYTLADMGGDETIILTQGQIPSHVHPHATTLAAAKTSPVDSLVADTGTTLLYADGEGKAHASNEATTNAGGSQPHNNMMPFLCVSFIISLSGDFPT
jgi:microcystin-dependent protein